MNYLHYEVQAGPNNVIQVTLDFGKQANVMLLDESNFQSYKHGTTFKYFGGLYRVSPVNLRAPRQSKWHVVIDLGGYAGSVSASVRVI